MITCTFCGWSYEEGDDHPVLECMRSVDADYQKGERRFRPQPMQLGPFPATGGKGASPLGATREEIRATFEQILPRWRPPLSKLCARKSEMRERRMRYWLKHEKRKTAKAAKAA